MSSPLFIFPSQLYNYDWIPPRLLGRGGNMRLVMRVVLEVRGKTVCRPWPQPSSGCSALFQRLEYVTSVLTFASPPRSSSPSNERLLKRGAKSGETARRHGWGPTAYLGGQKRKSAIGWCIFLMKNEWACSLFERRARLLCLQTLGPIHSLTFNGEDLRIWSSSSSRL